MTPRSTAFRRERESAWKKLDELTTRAEKKGLAALDDRDLSVLPALYRATVSSLGVARSVSLDANLIEYLESLSARAYMVVYGSRANLVDAVREFTVRTFPTIVRRHARCILTAWAVLLFGVALGFALTLGDLDRYYSFMSPEMAQGRGPESSTDELRDILYSGKHKAVGDLSQFAAFLFSNNARVGMLAFALGFAWGVPTILLLLQNGVILGSLAAVYHTRGMSLAFWGWVLPHGVTELTAIVLCGGAGLVLAQQMIYPGRYSRRENLAVHGKDAGLIVAGSVGLFFIAGLIEGHFRQLVHDDRIRWAVAVTTFLVLSAYFLRPRRRA